MSEIQIYHNPRCSKSRQTLALLQEKGIEPQVVEYLEAGAISSRYSITAEKTRHQRA